MNTYDVFVIFNNYGNIQNSVDNNNNEARTHNHASI